MARPKILENSTMIQVYLSEADKVKLTEMAHNDGQSVSGFVRQQVIKTIKEKQQDGNFKQA